MRIGVMSRAGSIVLPTFLWLVCAAVRAAVAGDPQTPASMIQLGDKYFVGREVPKDDQRALSWYRKAADAGNADAMCKVGWMYDAGRGVAKDAAQAVAWYTKAANGGNVLAMNNLGATYQKGRGVA